MPGLPRYVTKASDPGFILLHTPYSTDKIFSIILHTLSNLGIRLCIIDSAKSSIASTQTHRLLNATLSQTL